MQASDKYIFYTNAQTLGAWFSYRLLLRNLEHDAGKATMPQS